MSLIEQLKQIFDPRSAHGKRYPLWWLLLVMIWGSLCGYRGYRPLADFCQAHWQVIGQLVPEVAIPEGCPSYSTFRRVCQQVEYTGLEQVFNQWCQQWLQAGLTGWIGGDGKSIRCTRSDAVGANFISTVTLFSHTPGAVVAFAVMENQATSEIVVMRSLIRQLAGCAEVIFTLDALHCQKETVELIVRQQQHYLIAVKGNQKLLWRTLNEWVGHAPPLSVMQEEDVSHGRQVTRRVRVYDVPPTLASEWSQWQRVVQVERWGTRQGKPFHHQSLYITDLPLTAAEVHPHLQARWHIENRLHWVRDVTFAEDDPPRRGGQAPVNWAILHCWIITVVRQLGYRTIPQGIQALTNQVHQIFNLLLHGFSSA